MHAEKVEDLEPETRTVWEIKSFLEPKGMRVDPGWLPPNTLRFFKFIFHIFKKFILFFFSFHNNCFWGCWGISNLKETPITSIDGHGPSYWWNNPFHFHQQMDPLHANSRYRGNNTFCKKFFLFLCWVRKMMMMTDQKASWTPKKVLSEET